MAAITSELLRRDPAQHPLLLSLRQPVGVRDFELLFGEPCFRVSDIGDDQRPPLPGLRKSDVPHCCAGTAAMKSVLPPGSTMLA